MRNPKSTHIDKMTTAEMLKAHDLTGLDNETAEQYLKETNWNIRGAIALWEERK